MVEKCETLFLEKGTVKAESDEIVGIKQVLIPKGKKWMHFIETKEKCGSCTTLQFQNADFQLKSNILVQFLSFLLNEEMYEKLGVEEDLGYLGASTGRYI